MPSINHGVWFEGTNQMWRCPIRYSWAKIMYVCVQVAECWFALSPTRRLPLLSRRPGFSIAPSWALSSLPFAYSVRVKHPQCYTVLRIRNVYLGSEFFHPRSKFFPTDRWSASNNLSILTQKYVSNLSEIWFGLFIPDPDPDFLSIPDPDH